MGDKIKIVDVRGSQVKEKKFADLIYKFNVYLLNKYKEQLTIQLMVSLAYHGYEPYVSNDDTNNNVMLRKVRNTNKQKAEKCSNRITKLGFKIVAQEQRIDRLRRKIYES